MVEVCQRPPTQKLRKILRKELKIPKVNVARYDYLLLLLEKDMLSSIL